MIICADDFGLSPSVSDGIIELVQARRLSAVSCMMTEPGIDRQTQRLKVFEHQIDIGLHLVLTEVRPLSELRPDTGLVDSSMNLLPFFVLLRKTYTGRLRQSAISEEIAAQLRMFMDLFGVFPDFIDGHQHVQQLPGIREELLKVITRMAPQKPFYVRQAHIPTTRLLNCACSISAELAWKNYFIRLPSHRWQKMLNENSIAQNRYLLGYCDPQAGIPFQKVVQYHVDGRPDPRDIFFCHPGYTDQYLEKRDSCTKQREEVLRVLKSNYIDDLLESGQLQINRYFSS